MYEKQNFYAGQKLMASHLDAMEDAIIEALNKETVSSWNDLTDKPFGEEVVDGETVIKQIDPKYIPEDAMGVGSWDDLTNKPFYECEKEVTETMTIEWDGVVGDRAMYAHESGYFTVVRISDVTLPNADAAIGAVITINENGTETEETVNEAGVEIGPGAFMIGNNVLSVPSDNFECDLGTLPKKGLYSIWFDGTLYVSKYVGTLAHTVTELKKIDEKFLPEPLAYEKNEVVTETVTVEWDCVIGDRVVATGATMMDMPSDYVLLSDGVIATAEDALAMTGTMYTGGETGTLEEVLNEDLVSVGSDHVCVLFGYIISVFEDNSTITLPSPNSYAPTGTVTFPKRGTYSIALTVEGTPYVYASKIVANLSFKTLELKQIDPKFIPPHKTSWSDIEDAPFGDGTLEITWDGNIDGRETVELSGSAATYVHVSDSVLSNDITLVEQGVLEVTFDDTGDKEETPLAGQVQNMNGIVAASQFAISIPNDNTALGDKMIFPKRGIYFVKLIGSGSYNLHVSKLIAPGEVKKIDEQFMPESFGSIIVRSSTEGSTKLFKITVDDTGTISATEVV